MTKSTKSAFFGSIAAAMYRYKCWPSLDKKVHVVKQNIHFLGLQVLDLQVIYVVHLVVMKSAFNCIFVCFDTWRQVQRSETYSQKEEGQRVF